MPSNKQLLLFDLGGVLIEVGGLDSLKRMAGDPGLSDALISERWPVDPSYLAFEVGGISPRQFAEGFTRDWSLACTPDRFLEEFSQWTVGFFPGALELLDELRPRYRLAALSNSNEAHWQRILHEDHAEDYFERVFSSHQLGLRKPDPQIYETALKQLNVSAQDVIFFDDRDDNVQGAIAAGIDAYRVEGVAALRACLREIGCLP